MKKIYSLSLVLLSVMLALTACSEKDIDYTPGVPTSTAQVYFSHLESSAVEISPSENNFKLSIMRGDSASALTVPLKVTIPQGSIFSAPAEVQFAPGKKEADITFSYDPSKIEYGRYDTITVAIADAALTTQYGLNSFTFTAGVTAWKAMEGKATYREDFLTSFFSVDNIVFETAIEENFVQPGMYRLVNVYGKDYQYNDPGDYDDSKDYYVVINATDADHVYIEQSELGFDWNYGMFSMTSKAAFNMAKGESLETLKSEHPEYFGTLENGIITMPANSLLISMADYNDGTWYSSNVNGLFTVALPGSAIANYDVEFTKTGFYVNDDKEEFVRGTLTLGEDVEEAKYVVADAHKDAATIFSGIENGEIEAESTSASTTNVEASVPGSGAYAIFVVAYAKGKMVAEVSVSFIHTSPFETWKEVGKGTYNYTVMDLTADENGENGYGGVFDDLGSTSATLYQSEQIATRYRIAPWCDNTEYGMVFTLTEDDEIFVDQNYTGYTDEEYGPIYAADVLTYGAANVASYKAENGTYVFYLAYFDEESPWGYVADTFVPDAETRALLQNAPKAKSKVAQKNVKIQKLIKRSNRRLHR